MKKILKITFAIIGGLIILILALPLILKLYLWGMSQLLKEATQEVQVQYERMEEKQDQEDREFAALAVEEFKQALGKKDRLGSLSKQAIQPPPEYVAEEKFILKFKKSIENNKEGNVEALRLSFLPFFLKNDDIEYASKLTAPINTEVFKALAHSYFALFYAQNGDCQSANGYNEKLNEAFLSNTWAILRAEKPKNEMHIKRIIPNWSEAVLLCDNYVSALEVFQKHYPQRIAKPELLVRVYGDYGIAFYDAGQKDEASRFLKLADDLTQNKEVEKPQAITFSIIYGYLMAGHSEKAYELFKERQRDNPKFLAYPLNERLMNELAINGQIRKAISLMEDRVPPVLLIEAKKQLSKEDHHKFLLDAKSVLEKKSALPPLYTQVFADLYDLGYKNEAENMIATSKQYVEKAKLEDKHAYKTFLEAFLPALVQVEKVNDAEALLPDESTFSKSHGALYAHYILTDQSDKKDEIEGKYKRKPFLFQYGAVPYFQKIGDFERAEQFAGQSINIQNTYKRLYDAKIGKTAAHSFHDYQLTSYRELRERLK